MDMTYEDIENEFKRQVSLCSGIGPKRMNEILENAHPNVKRGTLIEFLIWHDKKFGSEGSDKIIAEIVDEYLTIKTNKHGQV